MPRGDHLEDCSEGGFCVVVSILMLVVPEFLASEYSGEPLAWQGRVVSEILGVVLIWWVFIRWPRSRLGPMEPGTAGRRYRQFRRIWWWSVLLWVLALGKYRLTVGGNSPVEGLVFLLWVAALLSMTSGLGARATWARRVGKVMAGASAFFFPWGTVLAVYSWWVLDSDVGWDEWQQLRAD